MCVFCWLQVELARVNGKSTETSTDVTRRRLFSEEQREEEGGGGVRLGRGWGGWGDNEGGQRRARNRRLQTAVRGLFFHSELNRRLDDMYACVVHAYNYYLRFGEEMILK